MLKGKNVVIGITGGIAAYKACDIVSMLKKSDANVDVIMTKNAQEFITARALETLSNNKVITDTFQDIEKYDVEHISLAKKADLFVIIPATANIIGKIAGGIADDMLSTTIMATKAPVLICPAMNTNMYNNRVVQDNIQSLLSKGYHFSTPEMGRLACGDIGEGKLASVNTIYDKIVDLLIPVQDYAGKNVLITAGGTIEHIDPIRYISNHSSGRMGIALASAAHKRGAKVTLVIGNITVDIPQYLDKIIRVVSTEDMYNAVHPIANLYDYIIMAAAPADYKIENASANKIKDSNLTLKLVKTIDIAASLGAIKNKFKLIAFAAETTNLYEYATAKLKNKNADMIVANDVSQEGAGFMVDTNIITIIDNQGNKVSYPKMLKSDVAENILNHMLRL